MLIKFIRDGDVIHETGFLPGQELPRVGEVVVLPDSTRRHMVKLVAKKFARLRGSGRLHVKTIEVELGPAPRRK